MTKKLNSIPTTFKIIKVNKKQKGIERPTSIPTLTPMLAMTRTITKKMAVIIFPSSSEIIISAQTVSSLVLTIERLGGKVSWKSDTTFKILVFASIAFAPTLILISRVMASLPFTLAKEE